MTHSWGQQVIRFYDLDGNLIEVGNSDVIISSLQSNSFDSPKQNLSSINRFAALNKGYGIFLFCCIVPCECLALLSRRLAKQLSCQH